MSDDTDDKPKRVLMPWEHPTGKPRGKRGRPRTGEAPRLSTGKPIGRPRKNPKKAERSASTTKTKPQVHLQQDRGIMEILREMSGASAKDLPPGDPPRENGAGVFENAAPDPKNFSDFESSETNQHTDSIKKYKPEYAAIAEKATRIGFTIQELADLFNVDASSVGRWILKYPEFANAVRLGRGPADDRIERNLFMRACGYSYIAEKPMNVGGKVEIAQYKEHVKPDIVAQIFWLKNRRPENWRDVSQHEHGAAGEFANMDDKQLMEEIQKASQELAKLSESNGDDQDPIPDIKH